MSHLAPRASLLALLAILAACAGEPIAPPPRPIPAPAVVASAPAPVVPSSAACAEQDLADLALSADDVASEDDRKAVATPEDPKDLCGTADSNLARAEAAILASTAGAGEREAPSRPWDHRSAPALLDKVSRRFALGKAERALLDRQGFVVPARLDFSTYAVAFHELYQSEMPLFVSVDAILHAVYQGNDQILARLERRRLAPLLGRTLASMACTLPTAAPSYPPEVARDLDVYLAVARSLLAGKAVPAVLQGDDDEVGALVAQAESASEMSKVTLFGRERWIDFTQLTPRGHYAGDPALTPYFRAAMWLARVELNLVSRSCRSSAATDAADPRETPREALDALALADLAERSSAMEGVQALDRAFTVFGGRREDVSLADLSALRARAGVRLLTEPGVFERLRAAIGEGWRRSTRIHFMPQGTGELPVITTLLGPRIVADTTATGPLVEPRTANRHQIGAADMGFALGSDRARAYLGADLAKYPELDQRLGEARALASAPSPGEDLYGAWLEAILALAARPAGALPSFMGTAAYQDLRLDTTVAAFAQIRHNAVLFAGQGYDQGGCEIPDGYVEPAPAVYDALIAYAERGASAILSIDPGDQARARGYFAGLAKVLRVLRAIGHDELLGRSLSTEQRRFLSMILEMTPGSSGGGPTYTGWYFDLFPTRTDALARASFIADYFTSGEEQSIAYAGAGLPRLGVFIVDTGGAPRAVVGPVARAYELHGPLGKRLDDQAAMQLRSVVDPWAASYTVAAPAVPVFSLSFPSEDSPPSAPAVLEARKALGPVTIEMLDHHRHPLGAVTRSVAAGKTEFPIPRAKGRTIEAIHVRIGDYHHWEEVTWQGAYVDTNAEE